MEKSTWISPLEVEKLKEEFKNKLEENSIEIKKLKKSLEDEIYATDTQKNNVKEIRLLLDGKSDRFQELENEYNSLQEEHDALIVEEEEIKTKLAYDLSEKSRLYEQSISEKELLQQEVRKLHQQSYDLKTKALNLQKELDLKDDWISPQIFQETQENNITPLKLQLSQQHETIKSLQQEIEVLNKEKNEILTIHHQSSELNEKLKISVTQLNKLKEMIQQMK